jgi:hypothetical protein
LAGKNWWLLNGRFFPKVAEKRQKNHSYQFIGEIPSARQFLQCFSIIKASKYVNREQFIPKILNYY